MSGAGAARHRGCGARPTHRRSAGRQSARGQRVVTGHPSRTRSTSHNREHWCCACFRPTTRPRPDPIDRHAARRKRWTGSSLSSPTATVPSARFSTARHENRLEDPDDTRMLDDVVRLVGQRVAAVAATSAGAAEEACRRIRVDYDVLPAVFDPEAARRPGAAAPPGAHRGRPRRRCRTQRDRDHPRSVATSPPPCRQSEVTVTRTLAHPTGQHAQLETHGTIGWLDERRSARDPHQLARCRS